MTKFHRRLGNTAASLITVAKQRQTKPFKECQVRVKANGRQNDFKFHRISFFGFPRDFYEIKLGSIFRIVRAYFELSFFFPSLSVIFFFNLENLNVNVKECCVKKKVVVCILIPVG